MVIRVERERERVGRVKRATGRVTVTVALIHVCICIPERASTG